VSGTTCHLFLGPETVPFRYNLKNAAMAARTADLAFECAPEIACSGRIPRIREHRLHAWKKRFAFGSEQAGGEFRRLIACVSNFGDKLVAAERAWLGRPIEWEIDPIEQRLGA
jgi:hypothetical protein